MVQLRISADQFREGGDQADVILPRLQVADRKNERLRHLKFRPHSSHGAFAGYGAQPAGRGVGHHHDLARRRIRRKPQ